MSTSKYVMNYKYDYEPSAKFIRKVNSDILFKNVEKIKRNKSPLVAQIEKSWEKEKFYPDKRTSTLTKASFGINRENKKFGELLEQTDHIKVFSSKDSPKVLQKKFDSWKSNNTTIFGENIAMLKRIMHRGPFINAKKLDKEYNTQHKKMLESLKKIKLNKKKKNDSGELILPMITWNNSTLIDDYNYAATSSDMMSSKKTNLRKNMFNESMNKSVKFDSQTEGNANTTAGNQNTEHNTSTENKKGEHENTNASEDNQAGKTESSNTNENTNNQHVEEADKKETSEVPAKEENNEVIE